MAIKLVEKIKDKKRLQSELKRKLKSRLRSIGVHNIGFPGGNVNLDIYSMGADRLWVAFGDPSTDQAVPRFSNTFGKFRSDDPMQTVTVEINIPANSNTAQVAGFFGRDEDTGDAFLFHSGKVGGGRPGVGRSAFLVWLNARLVDVVEGDGSIRRAVAISRLDDQDLSGRIWGFVRKVGAFKAAVTAGNVSTPQFASRVEEFDRYNSEYVGTKKVGRRSELEYITYHGDIVDCVRERLIAKGVRGEDIGNTGLIDLYVKRDGLVSEIFEVKTGLDRQSLYTGIGQLLTHSAGKGGLIAKNLVIPADADLPNDIERAVDELGIQLLRFRLAQSGKKTGG